jgi:O-antigen ligase
MKQILSMKPNWQYFTFAYVLFAAGFLFLIRPKYHNLFYYVLLLTPYVVLLNRQRLEILWQSSIFRLSLAYLGMVAVSVLWASPAELHKLPKYLFPLLYLMAFIALTIELTLQVKKFPDTVLKAILISATLWIPISIFLFYQDHTWSTRLEGVGRLENPLAGAIIFGMVTLLCLHVIIRKSGFSTGWRGIAATCGALCIVYLSLTQSRSPVVGLLLAGLVYAVLQRYWKLLQAILGITLMAGAAFYLDILPLDVLISRGLSYRPEIWQQALPAIMENPWFGHGTSFDQTYHLPRRFIFESHTHSAFIASLLFVGIIGTCVLLILMVQSFRYASSDSNHLVASLLTYAIVILFINGYELLDNPAMVWLYFWYPVALAAANEIKVSFSRPASVPS